MVNRNGVRKYSLTHHRQFRSTMRNQGPSYMMSACLNLLDDLHRQREGKEMVWKNRYRKDVVESEQDWVVE